MKKNNNIKCVIFDCDGVLVDSEKLCCQALVNVFKPFGVDASFSDFWEHFQGGKLADILAEAKDRLGVSVSIDDLEPLYREELESLFRAKLKPTQGIDELLDFLDQKNIEYCVVSNSPLSKIEFSLALTGLDSRFKAKCFSAFDANSWKPEPDLLIYAAMTMGYTTSECIYIDDTIKGVQAGVAAEIETYYYRTDKSGGHTEFAQVKHISDISELKERVNASLTLSV